MDKLIKKLTICLMRYNLKKAKTQIKTENNSVIIKAYTHCIKNYEVTILFLNSQIK